MSLEEPMDKKVDDKKSKKLDDIEKETDVKVRGIKVDSLFVDKEARGVIEVNVDGKGYTIPYCRYEKESPQSDIPDSDFEYELPKDLKELVDDGKVDEDVIMDELNELNDDQLYYGIE